MIRNSVPTCIASNGYSGGFAPVDFAKFLVSLPEAVFCTLVVWQRRAQDRANLKTMDTHMLNDIGLVRKDVDIEVSKPFWRS